MSSLWRHSCHTCSSRRQHGAIDAFARLFCRRVQREVVTWPGRDVTDASWSQAVHRRLDGPVQRPVDALSAGKTTFKTRASVFFEWASAWLVYVRKHPYRHVTWTKLYHLVNAPCYYYTGILDLNKLTLLCCSLGLSSFVFSTVSMLPYILVNRDFHYYYYY